MARPINQSLNSSNPDRHQFHPVWIPFASKCMHQNAYFVNYLKTGVHYKKRIKFHNVIPGLSIKWAGRRLVTDSGTKCAWVIHESKAVQIHVHNNRRCPMCLGGLVALKIRKTTTVSSLDLKEVTSPVNQQNYQVWYF